MIIVGRRVEYARGFVSGGVVSDHGAAEVAASEWVLVTVSMTSGSG